VRQPALALRPVLQAALLALCAAAAWQATPAHALSALDDAELAELRAQDGSIALREGAPPQRPAAPAGGLLSLLPADHLHLSVLDRAGFEAALAARGQAPLGAALYDGRPVTQVVVDGAPLNLHFEASALLLPPGLSYTGPSMGSIQVNGLDARGTTLWVWQH